ncbi:MAG: hypothetical protein ABI675_09310 [Chitinophagaceae bacterium]
MRKVLPLVVMTLFFSPVCLCQPNSIADKNYSERIYIHFDKDLYLPGESIFFKAYIISDGILSDRSSSLYIGMLDITGRLSQQKIIPIYGGAANGSLDIPLAGNENYLWIRAYTNSAGKKDEAAVFTKRIIILTGKQGNNESAGKSTANTELRFFPEGGSLIQGVPNIIAFEALQENGYPVSIKGVVVNTKGDTIASLLTSNAGMGKFELTPEQGEVYEVNWSDAGETKYKTSLPAAISNGLALHIEQLPGKLFYILRTQSVSPQWDSLYVVLSNADKELYRTAIFFKDKFLATGMMGIGKLSPGIVSVKVLDRNKTPVAERIVFLNKDAVFSKPEIIIKGNLSKRSKQTVEIVMPDSSFNNMSLSVFDDGFRDEGSGFNIAGYFLLHSELRGRIYEPAYYFSDTALIKKEQLDLLLLTHGWRRMRLNEDAIPVDTSRYITIEGTIKPLRRNSKMPQQAVLMIKEGKEKGVGSAIPVAVDERGNFRATGLVFLDSATVYCSIGKNPAEAEDYQVELKGGLKVLPVEEGINIAEELNGGMVSLKKSNTIPAEYNLELLNRQKDEKTLSEVLVKSKKMSRVEELDQRYASGLFSGGTNTTDIDVAGDSLAWAKLDIHNYLISKIPGAFVKYDHGQKKIYLMSYQEPLIFLNESVIDNDAIGNINIEKVAYVKFIRQYFGTRSSNGDFAPAIAIYLKKGEDLLSQPGNVNFTKQAMRGYSVTKEFYSPDYATFTPAKDYMDARTSLYWQPYILTAGKDRKVELSFYNNAISSRLRLVLQGINEEGKFIYEERLIQ